MLPPWRSRAAGLEEFRPLQDALLAMLDRLTRDPIFAAVFGAEPNLEFEWSADTKEFAKWVLNGPAAQLAVFLNKFKKASLDLYICPDVSLREALGCGFRYAEATPVLGDMSDIPRFLIAVEDMIAEFLADVAVSPVGDRFLHRGF